MEEYQKVKISDDFHNRYKIVSVLGKGGMGTVYLAEDLRLKGKRWAIKEIKIKESGYQQFIEEAKILISLEHPYLPKIIDYYQPSEEGFCYLVMDYINGRTLKELFERQELSINYERIIKYSIQLCVLFDYLHNKQKKPVIYRDLKPSNIIIDEFDNIRLIDFGIARKYKVGKQTDTIQLGTVKFAAPEQFEEKQTDQRADIYSLGALMYYLLSNGKYYYFTQKPLNHFRNDLSIQLLNIINKMLKKDPSDRYQNISNVKKELEELSNDYLEITEKIDIKTVEGRFGIKTSYKEEYTNFLTKEIIVANLSKRAGSTFITMNLAKCLSESNISTCVIELPFEPYIFDYIGIDQKLNGNNTNLRCSNFYSFAHEIVQNKRIKKEKEFIDKDIIWMVADPREPRIAKDDWTYNNMIKLLYNTRKVNVSIIDVGDNIEHQSIEGLIDGIDLILIIVDPIPSEILLNIERLKRLLEAKKSGVMIQFIINNWTDNIDKKGLIDVIGSEPIAYIPNINLSFIHKAVFNLDIPYDYKEVRQSLEKPLKDIINVIAPNKLQIRGTERIKDNNFLYRLLKR